MKIAGRTGVPKIGLHWAKQLKQDLNKLKLNITWKEAVKRKNEIRRQALNLPINYTESRIKGQKFKVVEPKKKKVKKDPNAEELADLREETKRDLLKYSYDMEIDINNKKRERGIAEKRF